MILAVEQRSNERGGTDTVLVGDHQAFFWLQNAAGPARDGFEGNLADLTDAGGLGTGDRLVLEPFQANGVRGGERTRLRALAPQPRPLEQSQTPGLELPRQLVESDLDKALGLIRDRLEVEDAGDTVIVIKAHPPAEVPRPEPEAAA